MAQLSTKISLYANSLGVSKVDFTKDVMLQDDMVDGVSNPYIKEWNLDIKKPTNKQLSTYETAGNDVESNLQVDATRREAYGTWGDQLDEIYHDIEAWKTRIAGIKSNNPKK